MEEDFNDVTQQIIALCPLLTQDVIDATEAVNDIESLAEQLAGTIRTQVEGLRQHLRGLTAALDTLEDKLRDARAESERGLEELSDAVTETGSDWSELLMSAGQRVDRFAAQMGDAATTLTSHVQTAGEDMGGLGARLEQLEGEAAAGQEAAWQALLAFGEAADAAWSALDARRMEWSRAVDGASEAATAGVLAYATGVARTLSVHAREAIDAGNDAIDAHNAALQAVELNYVRAVADGLGATSDQYMAALDAVDALPEAAGAILEPDLSRLTSLVDLLLDRAGDLAQALLSDGRSARP